MIHLFLGNNVVRFYRDQFQDCAFNVFEFPVIRLVSLINHTDEWVNLVNAFTPANSYWTLYQGSFKIKSPATAFNEMPLIPEGEYQLMLYKFASDQGNPNVVAAPNWLLYTPAMVTSAMFTTPVLPS